MIKKLPIQVIPFDIEELLKDMDVDKVSYINDASNNLQQTAEISNYEGYS